MPRRVAGRCISCATRAITHLANNIGLALLMAKSRHTSLRSLQRYAAPSADVIAALTAAHDRKRRRR